MASLLLNDFEILLAADRISAPTDSIQLRIFILLSPFLPVLANVFRPNAR